MQVGLKPKYLYWNKSIETVLQELDNSISKDKVIEIIKYIEKEYHYEFAVERDADKAIEILEELLEDK